MSDLKPGSNPPPIGARPQPPPNPPALANWEPVEWAQQNGGGIHIVRTAHERYAVRLLAVGVLNKRGEWEHEPMPSNRDEAFYDRCRFDSFASAVAAVAALRENLG